MTDGIVPSNLLISDSPLQTTTLWSSMGCQVLESYPLPVVVSTNVFPQHSESIQPPCLACTIWPLPSGLTSLTLSQAAPATRMTLRFSSKTCSSWPQGSSHGPTQVSLLWDELYLPPPQIHWNPNWQDLRMCPYLEIGSLQGTNLK